MPNFVGQGLYTSRRDFCGMTTLEQGSPSVSVATLPLFQRTLQRSACLACNTNILL
jgi:hypothetical protein